MNIHASLLHEQNICKYINFINISVLNCNIKELDRF